MRFEDIELLLSANRVLASTLDLDQLLKVVLKLAAQVVQAETGSLLLLDEKTNELVFDVALGEAGKELKTIRLKLGEGIAGWVAKENKPLIVNDPANDPRWTRRGDEKTKFVTRSILCVPLVYQDKLMGVVQAINRKDGAGFTEEDLIVLEAFAAQTAVAVQNARLFSSLRQEKEKVETIFSQMTEGAVFFDGDGKLLLANPSAVRLLDFNQGQADGRNFGDVLKSFNSSWTMESIEKNKADLIPFELARTEGKTLILAGLIKKIMSDKEQIIGYLTVFRDVTAERKEEKLKRDFLSLMSHKLKTPLVAITGYTPMLLEEEDLLKQNPFLAKAIKSIHTQGIHLKQLVEKLISFSLIESEQMTVEKKSHQAQKLLDDILKTMTTYLEEKKAQIVFDGSVQALPPLFVDYDKFRDVMKSLIENAAKFNAGEDKKIWITGKSANGMVSLTVKDNGRGIPREEFEKIFQKFYQIEESFTGQVEGAGLGLALVKRFVEVHNGRITLDSKLGEGSSFTVSFPAESASPN